jgi:hypothetical protein
VIGLLLGAMPCVRPADLLLSAIIGGGVLLALAVSRRLSAAGLVALAGGAALPILLYMSLHLAIYGPHPTRYMAASARIGFVFTDLGWKAYTVLITPQPWFPGAMSLVERMPWLLAGFAGLLALLPSLRGPQGRAWGLILITGFAYTVMMLAYADLLPTGLWTFNNAHYFKWLYPLLGVGVVLLVRSLAAPATRWAGLAGIVVTLMLTCIRIVPQPVGPDVPARMLIFAGNPGADWNAGYFAPSLLADRIGPMTNIQDFHQVPDGDRLRAMAIRRLIVGDAVLAQPGGVPQHGIARYGARIGFGVPCWFARSACAMR